jgi:hypothetical protein
MNRMTAKGLATTRLLTRTMGCLLFVALTCGARAQPSISAAITSPQGGAVVSGPTVTVTWHVSGDPSSYQYTGIQIDNYALIPVIGGNIIGSNERVPTSDGNYSCQFPLGTLTGAHTFFASVSRTGGGGNVMSPTVSFTIGTGSSAGTGDPATSIDPALLAKLNQALADQEKAIQALHGVVESRYQAFVKLNAAIKDVDAQTSTARGQTSGTPNTLPSALSALTTSLGAAQAANSALASADRNLDAATTALRDLQKQAGIALTGSSTQATLQRKQEQIIHDIRNMGDVINNLQSQDNSVVQSANDLAAAAAAANQALATNQKSDRVEVQGDRLAILFYGPPLGPTLKNADAVYTKRLGDAQAELKKLQLRWLEIEKARTATNTAGTSGF